jgi:short-subunit dehydrogenase
MRILTSKRVLITGAGHGLGKAIAQQFAQAGAEVIVTDRDAGRVAEVVEQLVQAKHTAFGYVLDVTSTEQIQQVRQQLHAEHGPIDVLINNAGIVQGGPFLEVPLERHRATIDINVGGVIALTHAFLPDLLSRPEGHLVNIASAAAIAMMPRATTYAASKWAGLGFTDSLREELRLLGHRHVGVTAICPSYIDTGLFAGARPPRLTWMLSTEKVARAVLRAVQRNREVVFMPWTVQMLYCLTGILPRFAVRWASSLLGVSTSMQNWRGHPEG